MSAGCRWRRCRGPHLRLLVPALTALAAGALVLTGPASAAQIHTFVSPATGSDTNNCIRSAPCLTLQRALNQTSNHRTITVLESGILGSTATISKAVTINVPAGVDAGLSSLTGTLLTVNAPSSAVVTINGLTLDGRGGTSTGISYTSGLALNLNRVTITDFAVGTPTGSDGINADGTVVDTHLKLRLVYLRDDARARGEWWCGQRVIVRLARAHPAAREHVWRLGRWRGRSSPIASFRAPASAAGLG